MGVLEQVSQMKSQGVPESEIVSRLKQLGVSPKDVNDALSQSQIKDAVNNPQETKIPTEKQIPMPEATYVPKTQEVEQEPYAPQSQDTPQPQEEYAPQPQEEYAPQQDVYQQEAYNSPQETYDSNMMIEIAEQVFNEKIKKVAKQIDKINDVQTILQIKTEHATERLKRIELIMDNLQVAILEKIGSYGRNLESIRKEMGMIENSFSKIIPNAKKLSPKKLHEETKKKTSKKK